MFSATYDKICKNLWMYLELEYKLEYPSNSIN